MEKVFFSSDSHFSHANIMKFCGRDFNSVHDMNIELTHNWNRIIKPEDTIWFLGDLVMDKKKVTKVLDKLNGKIHFVYGNHDRKARGIIAAHPKVVWTGDIATPTFNKIPFTLCHYAMRVWNCSHYEAIHLYGHSHGTLPAEGKSLDVGVDNAFRLLGEYRPFSLEEVIRFTDETTTPGPNEIIYEYVEYLRVTMAGKE